MMTTLNCIPLHNVTTHLNSLLLNHVWPHYNFGSTQMVQPYPDKLHAILFGTAQKAQSCSSLHSIDVAGSATPLDSDIKLLGVTLDSYLSMSEHTKLVSQSCFYHIWALCHICGVLMSPLTQPEPQP